MVSFLLVMLDLVGNSHVHGEPQIKSAEKSVFEVNNA